VEFALGSRLIPGWNEAKLKSKQKHMSEATFNELTASLEEAIAHARGQNTNLRVTRVKVTTPPKRRPGKAITKPKNL